MSLGYKISVVMKTAKYCLYRLITLPAYYVFHSIILLRKSFNAAIKYQHVIDEKTCYSIFGASPLYVQVSYILPYFYKRKQVNNTHEDVRCQYIIILNNFQTSKLFYK